MYGVVASWLILLVAVHPIQAQETLKLPEVSRGSFQWLGQHGKMSMVMSVALSPDGNYAASGGIAREKSADENIIVWNMRTGKEVTRLLGKYVFAFSPDSKWLLYSGPAGKTTEMNFWDAGQNRSVQTIKLENLANIRKACFAADGKSVYFAGAQADHKWVQEQIQAGASEEEIRSGLRWFGYVSQWSLPEGKLLRQMELPEFKLIYDLAITSDGKEIALGGQQQQTKPGPYSNLLILLDAEGWKTKKTLLQGEFGYIKRLEYVEQDSQLLTLGSNDSVMNFYQTQPQQKLIRSIKHQPHGPASDMAISPGQKFIVTAQKYQVKGLLNTELLERRDSEVVLWNYQFGLREHTAKKFGLTALSLAISRDSKSILIGFFDGRVGLWRLDK